MCGIELDIEPACHLTRPSKGLITPPGTALPFCFVFSFLPCSFLFRFAPCGFPSLSLFIFFFFCLSYSTFGWHAALTFTFAFCLVPFAFCLCGAIWSRAYPLFFVHVFTFCFVHCSLDPATLVPTADDLWPQLINGSRPWVFPEAKSVWIQDSRSEI